MKVTLFWRGSVTDFVTDLVQGALSRADLVALHADLERRGYGAPRGIPWADGLGPERECPVHGTLCHGAHCDYREGTCTAEPPLPAACLPETAPVKPRGIPCEFCELVHASDVTCGQAMARAEDARLRSPVHAGVGVIDTARLNARRDFDLAGPCPELCSCDESAWLRGRLRSVSRKLLVVAELARGGADAAPGKSGPAGE